MRTVIDVGCARTGGDSVGSLLEMFRPEVLHGFDPAKDVSEAMPASISAHMPDEGLRFIELHREAAWIYDGQIGYFADGLNSQIGDNPNWPKVRCIDLARFIDELPVGPIILKLDCEGAEYAILRHLIRTGSMYRLERLLVEWHCLSCGRGCGWHREECEGDEVGERIRSALLAKLVCPVEEWRR